MKAPDLSKLFDPQSIAVIGASNDVAKIPGMTMEAMLRHGVDVPVYPVHPREDLVHGLKAYRHVSECPGPVDLAIIIIPAKLVPEMLEDCGKAGVRAAIIITSGFAEEQGEAGRALQAQLQDTIRRYGMAVLGPNAQGYANFARSLCCTFSPAVRLAQELADPGVGSDGGADLGGRAVRRAGLRALRHRAAEGAALSLRGDHGQRGRRLGLRRGRSPAGRGRNGGVRPVPGGHPRRRPLPRGGGAGVARRQAADRGQGGDVPGGGALGGLPYRRAGGKLAGASGDVRGLWRDAGPEP